MINFTEVVHFLHSLSKSLSLVLKLGIRGIASDLNTANVGCKSHKVVDRSKSFRAKHLP